MQIEKLSDDKFMMILGLVLQQGAEKITNIRIEAGLTLLSFLSTQRSCPELKELIVKMNVHKDCSKENR